MKIRGEVKIKSLVLALIAGWLLMASGNVTRADAQTSGQGQELHETYDLAPNGTISVNNVSGHIRVTSWNENKVRVDAVKRGRRDDDSARIEIQVTSRPDRLEIRTNYPSRSSDVSVNYDLKVPRTAVLNSLVSTSGEISIVGPVARVTARSTSGSVSAREVVEVANLGSTSGNVRAERINGEVRANSTSGEVIISDVDSRAYAQSTSGSVSATRVRDDATVTATSGSVRVEQVGGRVIARSMSSSVVVNDAGGDVQAESNSSSVTVTNVRGRVVASTISGSVSVRQVGEGARLTAVSGAVEIVDAKGRLDLGTTNGTITLNNIDSRDVLAKSTSGSVRFAGKLYDDGHYEFESFSSDVVLILPPDSNFNLTTKSQSGSVNTEFPLQVSEIRTRGYLRGTVGRGGAEVRAASFSGNVFIRKGR